MRRASPALAVLLAAPLLSGCFLTTSTAPTVLAVAGPAGFQAAPVQGYAVDDERDILSVTQGRGPDENSFTVTFTADERIVLEDLVNNVTYTFTAADVQGDPFQFFDNLFAFATQLQVDAGGGDIESLSILTPGAENNPEYAIARLIDQAADRSTWLLVGEPTSAVLAGNATYTGGYYIDDTPGGTAIGEMTLAADFAGAADAIDFTFTRPVGDVAQEVFGVDAITFTADFDGATNRISGVGKAIAEGGAVFDQANVEGAFFTDGAASAGLVRFTGGGVDDAYGSYHALRD